MEPKKTTISNESSKEPQPKEPESREVEPKEIEPTSFDETLADLLGDNDVLDIQPLSVENSPLKGAEQRPSGARIFFGKRPKVCSNKPFKPTGIRTIPFKANLH